jgi:excisionase family DNA binding protein
MKTKEAAAYISASKSFLEKDRVKMAKIPFCKIGKRGVRYRQIDLDRYLEKNLKTSTSQDTSKINIDGLEYE